MQSLALRFFSSPLPFLFPFIRSGGRPDHSHRIRRHRRPGRSSRLRRRKTYRRSLRRRFTSSFAASTRTRKTWPEPEPNSRNESSTAGFPWDNTMERPFPSSTIQSPWSWPTSLPWPRRKSCGSSIPTALPGWTAKRSSNRSPMPSTSGPTICTVRTTMRSPTTPRSGRRATCSSWPTRMGPASRPAGQHHQHGHGQGPDVFDPRQRPIFSPNEAGQWTVTARNAFNGVLLWQRPISSWTSIMQEIPQRPGPVAASPGDRWRSGVRDLGTRRPGLRSRRGHRRRTFRPRREPRRPKSSSWTTTSSTSRSAKEAPSSADRATEGKGASTTKAPSSCKAIDTSTPAKRSGTGRPRARPKSCPAP